MKQADKIFEQAWVLQNQLRILIQSKVNEFNNPRLAYTTSLIINHVNDLDFNVYASLKRCNLDESNLEQLSEMIEEYIETADLVQRSLKLRK